MHLHGVSLCHVDLELSSLVDYLLLRLLALVQVFDDPTLGRVGVVVCEDAQVYSESDEDADKDNSNEDAAYILQLVFVIFLLQVSIIRSFLA